MRPDLSPEESLRIIHTMIEKTKEKISNQSIYFLLWGWGAFIGFTGQYLLKVYFKYPQHYRIWWISAVCFIISCVYSFNHGKKEKVKTYVDENMGNLWTGLSLTFLVLILLFVKSGWQNCYPFFILLYGTGTFISGKILRFKPLVIGGCFSFIFAAVSIWFNDDDEMLFAAVSILFSYIIPGHLLHNRYKKQMRPAELGSSSSAKTAMYN